MMAKYILPVSYQLIVFIVAEGHIGFAGFEAIGINELPVHAVRCEKKSTCTQTPHPPWTSFIPSIAKSMIAIPDCMHQFPEWLRGGQPFFRNKLNDAVPRKFLRHVHLFIS